VTDPPYPNNAGHFDDGISAAKEFCQRFACDHWIVFWDDVETPPVPLPFVARHSWHRTNTNRPDNCEAIYEFHADGKRRNSRVFPYCVIYPGMTGIKASGHPTEKHVHLMRDLAKRTAGVIVDPFAGSFSTAIACARIERDCICIELDPGYFAKGVERLEREYARTALFDHAGAIA
jgi:hypothetical protein